MFPVLTHLITLLASAVELARILVAPGVPVSLRPSDLDLVDPFASPPSPIVFRFQNRKEEAAFELLDATLAVRPEALERFSRFVRCWRTDRVRPMHERTVEIVAAVARHFDDASVEVISGYRARPYGAPHSRHFLGRAIDLKVTGVPAQKVAAWVWENFRGVGVGYYPRQGFVHIDTRASDARWTDTSRHGEGSGGHVTVRGRRPTDVLPNAAPLLAWDREIAFAALR
jgi:uncharacterized protein YcbK (DUF882 family)